MQESTSKKSSEVAAFRTAVFVWAKIGISSFGGPAAQIALMHKVVVEENQWLSERQFLNALNFCMLLPGPEAMQLATYAGWRMYGVKGGLTAGLLFVLPGAAVILMLAALYSVYGNLPIVETLFLGIKAAVLVIVLEALIKVSRRALSRPFFYAIATVSFVGIFFLQIPYPLIVIVAALVGYFMFEDEQPNDVALNFTAPVSFSATLRTAMIWMLIWVAPILVLLIAGAPQILTDIAVFFSKLAVVTFGGAYAVLAYMAQDVVTTNGWLEPDEMVDGLGLAETTPGPLILVTEFVGFLAAEKAGGIVLGVAGALVTLWVTFVPCFLWIFTGAPYIDRISSQPRLRGALSGITAAVVGVILNLTIWFAIHVMFSEVGTRTFGPIAFVAPEIATLDWRPAILGLFAGVLLLILKLNLLVVLTVSAISGLLLSTV